MFQYFHSFFYICVSYLHIFFDIYFIKNNPKQITYTAENNTNNTHNTCTISIINNQHNYLNNYNIYCYHCKKNIENTTTFCYFDKYYCSEKCRNFYF